MKIGIIGNGFVGKATRILECKDIEILSFDIKPELCIPLGITLNNLMDCECIFISVPTPMKSNGECYLNILNNVIDDITNLNYKGFIVIRSTIPIGTSDTLNSYFMPEFLTERNFEKDFKSNKDWIFGLLNTDTDRKFKETMTTLINYANINGKIDSNNVYFVQNKEAEMIKLFRNCYLSTKVSFCNEMYEFCNKNQVNYDNVRSLACNDSRILHSHSYVPGPDGKFGFGGTCFPKDTSSLKYQMDQVGMKSYVIDAIINRNNEVDRNEKDWKSDIGRAFIN